LPKFVLIDDYAHHPTEIKATLRAARDKYSDKNITCVFQPHQYQRTKLLFNDFVSVFQEALVENIIDKLLLIDVYDVKGREGSGDETEYTSERIALSLDNKRAKRIEDAGLKQELEGAEVVIMMGAGDIYNLSEELKEACRK